MIQLSSRQSLRLFLCCLILRICSPAQTVALTFDDLPETGTLPPGMTRARIGRTLAEQLKEAGAPEVYGFVNAGTLDDPAVRRVLERWRQSGFLLGNHTYSHKNLDSSGVRAFERDVVRNEPVLQRLMKGQDWHWFRYPYLAEGNTLDRMDAVREFLTTHKYRVAEVTIDFDDYEYNEPYARCLVRRDKRSINRLEDLYLASAQRAIDLAQARSRLLFGREIAQIMLLHFNGFEAVMLPRLLQVLKKDQFRFVTLEQAEADPAYAADPHAANLGGTFLEAMMQSKDVSDSEETVSNVPLLRRLCR